jgi:hypothetical protein
METDLTGMLETATQLGVAGLMGVLWIWERSHSRRRETELSETHQRLIQNERELGSLVELVRLNTQALVASEQMQKRMCDLLEGIHHEIRSRKAA